MVEKGKVPEAPVPAKDVPASKQTPVSPDGMWPLLVDPDGPVGYVAGPTPYIHYHEANEVQADGTVTRRKTT